MQIIFTSRGDETFWCEPCSSELLRMFGYSLTLDIRLSQVEGCKHLSWIFVRIVLFLTTPPMKLENAFLQINFGSLLIKLYGVLDYWAQFCFENKWKTRHMWAVMRTCSKHIATEPRHISHFSIAFILRWTQKNESQASSSCLKTLKHWKASSKVV